MSSIFSGIKITSSDGDINEGGYIGEVGGTVTFNCSSDLFLSRIEWYRDDTPLSQTNGSNGYVTVDVITTDDRGAEYSCKAVGCPESQALEKNITFSVKGKSNQDVLTLTMCYAEFHAC